MPRPIDPVFSPTDTFEGRHLGPSETDAQAMLQAIGAGSVEELIAETIPENIRLRGPLELPPARTESQALADLAAYAKENQIFRSLIGLGYSDTITPPVILRNILENPGWYTAYTPYQAEIAQGRLEALMLYQTMVADLTGMPLANASLLDEATAAAEAMTMAHRIVKERSRFFVAEDCHPQTIEVVRTRAEPLGLEVVVGDPSRAALEGCFGVLVQSPNTYGTIHDLRELAKKTKAAGGLFVVATDLLAATLTTPPGEVGADIVVGSAQRFGVPLGFGGPHAAFLATLEAHARQMPGRLIGQSKDAGGRPAFRMALQTREQHIRREKATSNICTAQVLLAVIAGMYAVYHGPEGLTRIARRIRALTATLGRGLERLGYPPRRGPVFDTLVVDVAEPVRSEILAAARARRINLRELPSALGLSLDETSDLALVEELLAIFGRGRALPVAIAELAADVEYPETLRRTSAFLTHPSFHRYRTEHEMLRFLHRLEAKDLSLTTSMIALGSCTMKLNATSEMIPVTWPELGKIHPFAPAEQVLGYRKLTRDLERWLAEITGFAKVSLQPNAGSQGEYAGLLVIRAHHRARGEGHRDVCLIPTSAHGTNPASAVMAGLEVVPVPCDDRGNVDVPALARLADQHKSRLACLMITYPSTHGVFEAEIREICRVVHDKGGQVYMDGANMNAQVGLCRPGDFGADVCHLNLHKTFCIPHGGGGPGMGPIAVAAHLADFLPGHPVVETGGARAIGPIAAAPFGSASILTIPWVYIAMMGRDGLRRATEVAILNANYMARRLAGAYGIVYTGQKGRVAHEFILDLRPFKKTAGIEAEDVAKRLMDYGFHAPTMSFPVAGTLMIEPTESESRAELDRLVDALLAIRAEIAKVEAGAWPKDDNPLKHAPHPAEALLAAEWTHAYSREVAAYPAPWLRQHKYWPPVARIDNPYGDRNLICVCPPMESYAR